jgi:hypothetical protein
MRSLDTRIRLVGALAAALLLTACGSSGGDDSGDGGDKPAAKDTAPTKADFKEAQTALTDLKADYQAVYEAGGTVQKTSVAYFKSNPKGTADDAALDDVKTAFEKAVDKRDDAADEVEDLKAMKDPDVAQAYETFAAKAEKGDQYHDTLFAAFPLLQQVFSACGDVFTSTKPDSSPDSATAFGRTMLARYEPAIADCVPVLDKLSDSENANLASFGSGFNTVVEKRRTLMTNLSTGRLGMPAFTSRYEAVGAEMSKVAQNIDFQKQLNALSPVPEFLALEKVVAGKAA